MLSTDNNTHSYIQHRISRCCYSIVIILKDVFEGILTAVQIMVTSRNGKLHTVLNRNDIQLVAENAYFVSLDRCFLT